MGIALRFDLAPKLLNVMASLIPALLDVRFIRIKTTSMPMMVVGFHILTLCEPSLDRSPSQANPLGDLFDLHPLLTQRYHLLIALIPLGLVRGVRLSIRSDERA